MDTNKKRSYTKTMKNKTTNPLAESYVELINVALELGAVKEFKTMNSVINTVFAEIASSELSPTRKEASLQTLRRVIDLYSEQLKEV